MCRTKGHIFTNFKVARVPELAKNFALIDHAAAVSHSQKLQVG